MSLKKKFNVIILLIIFVPSIFLIGLTNFFMKRMAYREAYEKMEILTVRTNAIHEYLNQVARPVIFELMEEYNIPDSFFRPEIMSSTYAVREINNIFKANLDTEYYFKEIADNPRNPENQADAYEREILELFNRDRRITSQEKIGERFGEMSLIFINKGEVLEESCLRCHYEPANAPLGLIEVYGDERGFYKQAGEVVSAQSVAIPLTEAYAFANRLSLFFALAIFSLMGFVYISISKLTDRDILSRIRDLENYCRQVMEGKLKIGENLPAVREDEIGYLQNMFNKMALKIKQYENKLFEEKDNLQDKIDSQMHELEKQCHALETLNEFAQHLSSAKSESDIFQHATNVIKDVMDFDLYNFTLVEKDELMVRTTNYESEVGGKEFKEIANKIHATKKAYWYYQDQEAFGIGQEKKNYQALIATPLADLGVLQVATTKVKEIGENEVNFIKLLAGHIVEALKRSKLEKKLWEQAIYDSLTGLYNRFYFKENIQKEIDMSIRYSLTFTIMMLDINNFKLINDTYGHMMGDEVLQEISSLIRANVRQTDWIVRYGGDEFLIVMPNTSHEGEALATRLKAAVQEWRKKKDNISIPITLSVGISYFGPNYSIEINEVLKEADEKMYQDKSRQKSCDKKE